MEDENDSLIPMVLDLPFDIKLEIASKDISVWRTLVLIDSDLGRYSLGNGDPDIKKIRQDDMKRKNLRLIKTQKEEYYVLPNGTKYGPYKKFVFGKLQEESFYIDGKLDGSRKIFGTRGQIWKKENYKNGLKDGSYTSYYNNGNIKVEANYVDGKKEGPYTSYYTNGKIIEFNYVDGEKEGLGRITFPDGTITEKYYVDGKVVN